MPVTEIPRSNSSSYQLELAVTKRIRGAIYYILLAAVLLSLYGCFRKIYDYDIAYTMALLDLQRFTFDEETQVPNLTRGDPRIERVQAGKTVVDDMVEELLRKSLSDDDIRNSLEKRGFTCVNRPRVECIALRPYFGVPLPPTGELGLDPLYCLEWTIAGRISPAGTGGLSGSVKESPCPPG